jgi:hypothetical protein
VEVELRDGGFHTVADVDEMTAKLAAVIGQVRPPARAVIVADWRACKVLTPAVAERAVTKMTSINARIERSAVLHAADASTSVLQLMRLVKETNAPYRRLFTETQQLREWMGELLSPAESDRLRDFLMAPRSQKQ